MEVEKLAFEQSDRGYTIKASYLKQPNAGDALIEITKDGSPLRCFTFPAYKIWNLSAHFRDIVDGELDGNDHGYRMAAWDGISGAIVLLPKSNWLEYTNIAKGVRQKQ